MVVVADDDDEEDDMEVADDRSNREINCNPLCDHFDVGQRWWRRNEVVEEALTRLKLDKYHSRSGLGCHPHGDSGCNPCGYSGVTLMATVEKKNHSSE